MTGTGSTTGSTTWFGPDAAATVLAATARLVPGPEDDPDEAGHPGAREAGVVHYVDRLLGADPRHDGAPVHVSGPWSDRAGGTTNHMTTFVPLTAVEAIAWTRRLRDWRERYAAGIALLDELAGGRFADARPDRQDAVLADPAAVAFRDLLFEHTVEGMYANPEYGGNTGRVGWVDIGFPGDRQPRGWSDDEVSRSDGVDPVRRSPIVDEFLTYLEDPPE